MDILEELNLSKSYTKDFKVEDVFLAPGSESLSAKSVFERDLEEKVFFETKVTKPSPQLPIDIKQIKVKIAEHPIARTEDKKEEDPIRDFVSAKFKPSIDYKKIFNDFSYFFNLYPMVSLNNFKSAEKLFLTYFANRRELVFRLQEFKNVCETFSNERDKFGKLSFDFKIKKQSIQITLQRSRLKGIKQYLSISLLPDKDFLVFTQWDWKHKKEELIRSRNYLKEKKVTPDSLIFDAKVWQAFNKNGLKRKHMMKSLDCLERNKDHIIDFIKLANKKTILNFIEPDLFSNVSIKSDNQNTTFLNFRSNSNQKIETRLTNFASSIVVSS